MEKPEANKLRRKCVLYKKHYYYAGDATFTEEFKDAKIYNYEDVPYFLKRTANKIIFLDSPEGLELIVDEFLKIDSELTELKDKVNELEYAKNKIYNLSPAVISKYIGMIRKREKNQLVKMNYKQREQLLQEIIREENAEH